MNTGDLDTESASTRNDPRKSSLIQSMMRSLARESSRSGATGNRSRSNTGPRGYEHAHGPQPAAYGACLSSLSFCIHDGAVTSKEEDDPFNGICFFHPPNYTETEQWEFTGPIIGAVRFMSSFANSPPKIIHLANSSIALLCVDQYTIALKASKVLCANSLESCLRDLYGVFILFFNDLKFVKKLCRDDDKDVELGRFKYNLAHIWTRLIGLVGPCKLLHPIAHIPHFVSNEDIESQLYQFFACIIAILSSFSGNAFGCLLSYDSQLVQSTFDLNLTRTLMLSSSLMRTMPQTAHVLPPSSRLPKSVFLRYVFAPRSHLLESRNKLRDQMKNLPPAAQLFMGRFVPSMMETAFSPRSQQNDQWSASLNQHPTIRVSDAKEPANAASPNNEILSRYFDFAWAMAGHNPNLNHRASLDASFSTNINRNQENAGVNEKEQGDHWESRSSSMSGVAVNLNAMYGPSYAPLNQGDPSRSRSVSFDELGVFPPANFDQLWADNVPRHAGKSPKKNLRSSSSDNQDPFGQFSRLSHVLKSDADEDDHHVQFPPTFLTDEDKAFSVFGSVSGRFHEPSKNVGTIADDIRQAASRLSTFGDAAAVSQNEPGNSVVTSAVPFSATGFLDSGHSSLQGPETILFDETHEQDSNAGDDHNTTVNSDDATSTRPQTSDSGNPPTESASMPQLLDEAEMGETVETVLYYQNHGPLSLIALVPNSPSLIKNEHLRRLYDLLLPILADVCTLLLHLDSETARTTPSEAVVVSFEPTRQRLHRLGLCRACNSDIRFDTQLFGIQRLFAKDSNIRDLQISDWSSHVRVTKENTPPPPEVALSDALAPSYHSSASSARQSRHSYIKVKRNGCASSLLVLPNGAD